MKKKIIIISSIILIVIGFVLSINAFAWSITTKEMLYFPLWIITIIGFLIFLKNKKTGNYLLIAISTLWLIQLADTLGWFLTFEPENIALWGLIGIPTIASLLIAINGAKNIDIQSNKRIPIIAIAALIPILGILSYANKTYDRNVFSEFYDIDKEEYKAVFKPQPSDTRKFEMIISSNELRNLVQDNATFVANHYYFPNAKFKVNMTFSRINEIELYQVSEYELEEPINWKTKELKGETAFLK
jgi:hypothetical protein